MTTRRHFLTTVTTATAGLVVGEAALEAYERLTHRRRVWAYPTNPAARCTLAEMVSVSSLHGLSGSMWYQSFPRP